MNTLVRPLVRVRIRDNDIQGAVLPEDEIGDKYDQPFDLADTEYRVVMNCRGQRDAARMELHNNQPTIRPKTTHPLKREVKS